MGGYHRQVLKQSIVLGIYFMLTYTTFLSFSCIITYIAENQPGQYSYGPLVALSVNYSTYIVALIFSPAITKFKWQFLVSAICHMINYAVYIPDFTGDMGLLMGIIGALFGGYGAAIYWVSQGGYLMKLFLIYGIPKNEQGKYFGITNGIVYGSSLLGSFVTTFGLGYFGSTIYFTLLTILGFISWLVCFLFLDDLEDKKLDTSLLTESNSSIEVKQPKTIVNPAVPPQGTLWQQIKSIFIKTMKYYPNMYYMYIPIILDGIISSFISIYFSKLIYEGIRDRLNVGYLLMSEGVGCIFGAILSAFMSDKYSVINVGRAGIFAVLVTCGLTFANYMIQPTTMGFPLLVGISWGFVINYITSWESVSCAKINNGCLESFSIVRQIQAITSIIFFLAMITTDNEIDLPFFLCVVAALCVMGMVIFLIFQRWNSKVLQHQHTPREVLG